MQATTQPTDKFIGIKDVMNITQASRTKIYRDIQKGRFPQPVKMVRRTLWPLSEINAWIEQIKQAR